MSAPEWWCTTPAKARIVKHVVKVAPRMRLRYSRPTAPLANFVEVFWLSEDCAPAHALERHLPSGPLQVIFSLRGDALRVFEPRDTAQATTVRGPLIAGPRDEYTIMETAQQQSLLGIQLKPGGAPPFLAMPTSGLRNTHVGLDALWGAAAHELHEGLLAATTAEARFAALESALLTRLASASHRYAVPHPAVAFALRAFHAAPQTWTVAEVTEHIGLSPRRFIEVFSEAVGLTPKTYCRIQRFQAALRRMTPGESVSLAEVAASCGYYDQSHFIHDFRAFSGLTPSAYLARHGEHHNHVPLDQ